MEWVSFKYKGDDRVALLIADDQRGIDCQLAWQISKAGVGEDNIGFRSFKDELILSKEPHPPRWDLVPPEVQEQIVEIEKASQADRPGRLQLFFKWLADFKKVITK